MSVIVKIGLERIQTFLFAVPRLADIVGANALLGEVMRIELPKLAQDASPPETTSSMPNATLKNDPLASVSLTPSQNKRNQNITPLDDPKALWEQGIITRDGGHFQAHFPDENMANAFIQAARQTLQDKLPGIRCEIRKLDAATLNELDNNDKQSNASQASRLMDLPLFQPCEETGNGPAVARQEYKAASGADAKKNKPSKAIGKAAQQRKQRWWAFKRGKTRDIASLMRSACNLTQVETFEALCGEHYLALIHADGNNLGNSATAIKEKILSEEGEIEKSYRGLSIEVEIEKFFQCMRTDLRRAIDKAIEDLRRAQPDSRNPICVDSSLQILMLGGDDLLVACSAPLALPFVNYLAKALAENEPCAKSIIDKDKWPGVAYAEAHPLTLGIGVAIAKPAFPFHRLHDLCEELASSAKRQIRNCASPISAVDWLVCSESTYSDLEHARRHVQLRQYQVNGNPEYLACSAKPYPVLEQADSAGWSLEELLKKTDKIRYGTNDNTNTDANPVTEQPLASRSQLRSLWSQLSLGRRQADAAYQRLAIGSPSTWEALKSIGFNNSLWVETEAQYWKSHFGDFVEILEIPRLTTDKQDGLVMDEEADSETGE